MEAKLVFFRMCQTDLFHVTTFHYNKHSCFSDRPEVQEKKHFTKTKGSQRVNRCTVLSDLHVGLQWNFSRTEPYGFFSLISQ